MSTITRHETFVYPERDGKPMGETDSHVIEIADLFTILRDRYRNEANTYVGANMLCYYEEGIPTSTFCPDVFVVFGIPKKSRRTYKTWEEQKSPTVIFEVTSRGSRVEDLGNKKYLYANLGVEEYFLYDPLKEYLRPPLQGFRLQGSDYLPLEADSSGALLSQKLGLRIQLEANGIALTDTATGERLSRPLEDKERLRAAEAELEKLRAELKRRG